MLCTAASLDEQGFADGFVWLDHHFYLIKSVRILILTMKRHRWFSNSLIKLMDHQYRGKIICKKTILALDHRGMALKPFDMDCKLARPTSQDRSFATFGAIRHALLCYTQRPRPPTHHHPRSAPAPPITSHYSVPSLARSRARW